MVGGCDSKITSQAVRWTAGHRQGRAAPRHAPAVRSRRACPWVVAALLALAAFLGPAGPAGAQNVTDGPRPCAPQGADPGGGGSWAAGLAGFYRDYISAVDGNRCPSVPSCSAYSVQAFEKHGFCLGWLMTVDRLIHEADEAARAPLVEVDGQTKIWDPVANNDFWWFKVDAGD